MHLQIRDIVTSPEITADWALPALGARVRSASLSMLLPTLPDIERALLPNATRAVTAINRALRARPYVAPAPTTVSMRAYGRVGLAVDRAALFLSGQDIVSGPIRWLPRRGSQPKQLSKMLAAWRPRAKGLFHSPAAIGWLYVLGSLDSIRRGFVPFDEVLTNPLPARVSPTTSRAWFEGSVPQDTAAEIVMLLRALKEIRIRGKLVPNPVFGGIGPISGSDGDWIVDDTLVELKCVTNGVKRRNVAQLIGYYALAQLPDRRDTLPPFSRLALCLPRQATTIIGTVDEWLGAFGAPPKEVVTRAFHRCFDPHDMAGSLAGTP